MVFPVVMYGCESWKSFHKESWVPKNLCFWTVVLKTLESPLDCKEIQPVHPKGDQAWMFIGRANVEAETPILWPPGVKSWFIWKDPDAEGRRRRDDRGWDGWMASPTQWTWVWVNSRSWWWTGRPGVLWFIGSQRVGYDWVTQLNTRYWGEIWKQCKTCFHGAGDTVGWYTLVKQVTEAWGRGQSAARRRGVLQKRLTEDMGSELHS